MRQSIEVQNAPPLDIADDVQFAAKEVAPYPQPATPGPPGVSERLASYGIHPLPTRGALVCNDTIDRLRDADGI